MIDQAVVDADLAMLDGLLETVWQVDDEAGAERLRRAYRLSARAGRLARHLSPPVSRPTGVVLPFRRAAASA